MRAATQTATAESSAMTDTVASHIGTYLTNKAKTLNVDRRTLSMWMYVVDGKLIVELYKDNKEYLHRVQISDVTGFMWRFMAGVIQANILGGFKRFASEKRLDVNKLKLKLYYNHESELTYAAYHDMQKLNVDLIEFFKA